MANERGRRRPEKAAEKDTTMPRRSTPDAFALQVGTRIRELRHEQGLSLGALADASALSKGHLSSVEHGLAAITIHTIARLAVGFGVPPLYLLTFAKEDERAHVAELLRRMSAADVKKFRRQLQAQVGKR
jgi:transcriptional regulator with XRE-family HTH domain